LGENSEKHLLATRANIKFKRFKRTRSALDEKRSGRPQTSENDVDIFSKQLSKAHVHQFAA
jgi:hypothetical protein